MVTITSVKRIPYDQCKPCYDTYTKIEGRAGRGEGTWPGRGGGRGAEIAFWSLFGWRYFVDT